MVPKEGEKGALQAAENPGEKKTIPSAAKAALILKHLRTA
jgi:hypothetical protein